MKTFSGPARFTWHQSTHQKALCLVLVLGTAMFAAGCGKNSEKPSSSATPPLQTTATATNVAAAPDLMELTIDLRRWCARNHRVPASFEEFSATAGVDIPPPTAGKKYVIGGNMQIKLVDR